MALSTKLLTGVLSSTLLLAGCGSRPRSVPAAEQRRMPAFELETLDGTRFSSTALAGKVALVDFWATWCQPCLEEIPFWNQLQQRYSGRSFTVLGIAVQCGWAGDIKSDIEKMRLEIKYPVVVGNEKVAEEFGGVLGFPTTFLVTRDGRIHKKYVGQYAHKQTEIERDIQEWLARR
jgi:thiol-disulfide isomerase/thioredoxin